MSTTFPASIDDTWDDPSGSSALSTSPDGRTHSEHHTDLQDVVLSVEAQTVGTPLVSSAGYSDHAGIVLNAAESLSDGTGTWGSLNGHGGDTPSLDSSIFTTGSSSVTCDLNVGTSGATFGRLYVDLPAPLTVSPYHTISVDVRFNIGLAGSSPNSFAIMASDGAGLTGTVVESQIDSSSDSEDLWFTWTVDVSTLTTVASIGIKKATGTSGSGTRWLTWWLDNIVLQPATAIDSALSVNDGAVVVPADYTPSVDQFPNTFSTVRQVLDLRTDHANLAGAGGVYNLRDWRIDETGTQDVTADVQRILDDLPNGATLQAPSTGIFRVDSRVSVGTDKTDITFDGNGSRWFQPTEVDRQFFSLGGTNNTIKNFKVYSLNSLDTTDVSPWASGDSTHPIVGSPTASGTTVLLNDLGDQVEIPWRGADEVAYYARDHLGVNHWEFILSDSAQVANDCKFQVMSPDGTVLQTTTQTLTSTPTTYEVTYVPDDLYLPLRVSISKAGALTNTITLSGATQYGRQRYVAALAFNHFVAVFGTGNSVLDSWAEGVGGDLVTSGVGATKVLVQNCTARVNGRMGLSVTSGQYVTWRNCEVLGSGQWAHDFEPDSSNTWMSDIVIDGCRFIDPSLGFIASTGWAHARKVHIRNCDYLRTSARGGLWMDGGWWEGDVTNCTFMRKAAGPNSALEFRGRGTTFANIVSSGGISFLGGTKSDENGLVLAADYNSVDGWRAYDPDVLTASAITNYSFANCTSLGGHYEASYP